MQSKKYQGILLSDFTIENLAGMLNNDPEPPVIETCTAPFGQVMTLLLDENHKSWQKKYDFALVWTQPQEIIESFKNMLNYESSDIKAILKQVDEYCDALQYLSNRVNISFVTNWVLPTCMHGFGLLEMKSGIGFKHALLQMNQRLLENVDKLKNIFVLDAQKWTSIVGRKAFSPKLYYSGKIPYSHDVFYEAMLDIKSSILGLTGQMKKLVIVDLDDTLWGGIVGDDGWENLRLGGHDFLGEAFVDFQRALKSLTNRGIILGIVSKNEEKNAIEAFEKHPEMVLTMDDFAGWKINWHDKAQNIVKLVHELNLGLQSVVFLDDNPVERSRVREALREVFVPELPEDKMLYASFLHGLRCFDTPSLSEEDRIRTEMYVSERKRKDMQNTSDSINDWLKSLDIRIKVECLDYSNIVRTTQLLNKTNQMNLTTRRLTQEELAVWEKAENHRMWTFRVSDKFGDYGLVGIISLELNQRKAKICDFVMSCRVIGRKAEESMIYKVFEYAKSQGIEELLAVYIPTNKNQPCLEFWKRSGFQYNEETKVFSWNLKDIYPAPEYVCIEESEIANL